MEGFRAFPMDERLITLYQPNIEEDVSVKLMKNNLAYICLKTDRVRVECISLTTGENVHG